MKIIYNKYIPFGRKFLAINVLGIVFAKGNLAPSQRNHEYIHTKQQIELLFVFFYLLYIIEWIFRLFQYRNLYKAYYNISFEREAYSQMKNLNYIENRSLFAWTHYIRQHNECEQDRGN